MSTSLYTQASEQTSKELVRHALVSIANKHICNDCFCCMAFEVLGFRYPQLRNQMVNHNGRLDYRRLEVMLHDIAREIKAQEAK